MAKQMLQHQLQQMLGQMPKPEPSSPSPRGVSLLTPSTPTSSTSTRAGRVGGWMTKASTVPAAGDASPVVPAGGDKT